MSAKTFIIGTRDGRVAIPYRRVSSRPVSGTGNKAFTRRDGTIAKFRGFPAFS